MTSPDGVTWTTRSATEANNWNGVIWAKGIQKFIAVASDGTNREMHSGDGLNWTTPNTGLAIAYTEVCWSDE